MLKLPKLVRRPYAAVRYRVRQCLATVHRSPVFVLGNQKSGTTAIAALLAQATGQQATLDFFYRREPREVERYHQGSLTLKEICTRNKLEFSRKIIKDPDLTFFASDLVAEFPEAKFLFVLRDPYQNIRSILNRWSLPGTLDQLSPEIRRQLEASRSWQIVFDGATPATAGPNPVATLANRWEMAVQAFRQIEARCCLVRYEDFCAQKERCIAELASQLGLPVRHDIQRQLDHPFQPRGADSGQSPAQFFSPANLEQITKRCWPTAADFHYRPAPLNE
ncbi:MAG: sulfotransferase [Mariniblastus sp.]|nr:sulfotransferase [Mariniblastus sp.]